MRPEHSWFAENGEGSGDAGPTADRAEVGNVLMTRVPRCEEPKGGKRRQQKSISQLSLKTQPSCTLTKATCATLLTHWDYSYQKPYVHQHWDEPFPKCRLPVCFRLTRAGNPARFQVNRRSRRWDGVFNASMFHFSSVYFSHLLRRHFQRQNIINGCILHAPTQYA